MKGNCTRVRDRRPNGNHYSVRRRSQEHIPPPLSNFTRPARLMIIGQFQPRTGAGSAFLSWHRGTGASSSFGRQKGILKPPVIWRQFHLLGDGITYHREKRHTTDTYYSRKTVNHDSSSTKRFLKTTSDGNTNTTELLFARLIMKWKFKGEKIVPPTE